MCLCGAAACLGRAHKAHRKDPGDWACLLLSAGGGRFVRPWFFCFVMPSPGAGSIF